MVNKKPELWQSEAMRLGGEALVEKIFEIADDIKEMRASQDNQDDRTRDLEVAVQNIYKAFPGTDVEGHRRAHEAMIEDIATRKRLTEAIREKTLSGLVWAVIVGVAMAVWHEIQVRIGDAR